MQHLKQVYAFILFGIWSRRPGLFFFQVILLLVSFFLPNEDMNLRYVSFWALEKVLASQPVAGAAVLRR